MPPAFEEMVVVITGGSSGIGRATALGFADRGAAVVLASRDAAALGDIASQCEQRGAAALAARSPGEAVATTRGGHGGRSRPSHLPSMRGHR